MQQCATHQTCSATNIQHSNQTNKHQIIQFWKILIVLKEISKNCLSSWMSGFVCFLSNLGRTFNVQYCSPMMPRVQAVRHYNNYADRNWLWDLCHLHLPHKSERAEMHIKFQVLQELNQGLFTPTLKTSNCELCSCIQIQMNH